MVQTCRCCGAAASPPQKLRPFLLHGYGPGIGMGMGGMGAFPRLRYLPASIQPSSLFRSHTVGLDLAASASQKCQGFYYDMCMDSERGTLKNHLVLFKPLLSLR